MERSRAALVVLALAATIAVAAALIVWIDNRDTTPTTPTTSPTVESSTPTPTVVIGGTPGAGLLATAAPEFTEDVVELAQFSSPTGNIGCVMSTNFAVCEIGEHDFPLPPEPATCSGDWAATFELTDPTAPPIVGACQTDTALGAADLLAYGSTSAFGDFACLSQESGLTCWHRETGHGFTVSRAAYALF